MIRSNRLIRTSDTRHFVDPSIGTAALGLGPNDLMNDLTPSDSSSKIWLSVIYVFLLKHLMENGITIATVLDWSATRYCIAETGHTH